MKILDELEQIFSGEFIEEKYESLWDAKTRSITRKQLPGKKHNLKLDFNKALSGNKAAGRRVRAAFRLIEIKSKLMRDMMSERNLINPSDEMKQQIRAYKLDKALEL